MCKIVNIQFCCLLILFSVSFIVAIADDLDGKGVDRSSENVETQDDISTDDCQSDDDCKYLGRCRNVGGRKVCECLKGLSGRNCENIDECVENPDKCGQDPDVKCSFSFDKKKALCRCSKAGTRFDVPSKKCVDQKPCLVNKDCHNGGTCFKNKKNGIKYCACPYGTSGDFCERIEECIDNPNFCGEGNQDLCNYNNRLLRAYCQCQDNNQRFDLPLKQCVNRTECDSNKDCLPYGVCINKCRSFEPCLSYERLEDKDSCHCVEGTSGEHCEVIDDCHKKIVDCGTGSNVKCKYFYVEGITPSTYCECEKGNQKFDSTEKVCKDCDCGAKGTSCRFKKGKRVCECSADSFNFGDRCEDCKCGRGSSGCNFKDGVKECFCKNGFKELNGTCEVCDCGPNSTDCTFKDGSKVCTCKEGNIQGSYGVCTPKCDDKHMCENGGRCLQNICVCPAGTGGLYCERIYDCEDKLCGETRDVACRYDMRKQRAHCLCQNSDKTFDSYDKTCKNCTCGFQMQGCSFNDQGEKICKCSANYIDFKGECRKCDCGENGDCKLISLDKYFTPSKVCKCDPGYVENDGKCEKCNCGGNGECSFNITTGQFRKCNCDRGFAEDSGKCKLCDCGFNSECSYKNSTKICSCGTGFMEKRGYCTDINECYDIDTCPGIGTECENTFGSYKCRCREGYRRRPITDPSRSDLCEKIEEVQPDYTPWKIGYGIVSAGFVIVILGLLYIIFRLKNQS